MCAPLIAVAAIGLSAAAAGTQYASQQSAAGAASKYENQSYTYTKRSATANYLQEVNQIQERSQQQYAQASDQDTQQKLQQEGGKAKAQVAFGQRGVAGNSTKEALGEFDRIEQLNHTNLARNLNFQYQQAGQDAAAARAQANDRIAGATPQPVQYPSSLAAGLNLGTVALQGANTLEYATQSGVYNPNNPGYLKAPLPII